MFLETNIGENPSIGLSMYLSINQSVCTSIYLSIHQSILTSICTSIHFYIYLSVSLSIYLSMHESIPSIHPPANLVPYKLSLRWFAETLSDSFTL